MTDRQALSRVIKAIKTFGEAGVDRLTMSARGARLLVVEIKRLRVELAAAQRKLNDFDAACRHESDDLPMRVRAAWESLENEGVN